MPVVAIFGHPFGGAGDVAARVAEALDYPLLGPDMLEETSRRQGASKSALARAMGGAPSLWEGITHDLPRGLIHARAALARVLRQDALVLLGPATLLIPRTITHVLRVCVGGPREERVARAQAEGLSPRKARQRVEREDKELARWGLEVFGERPFSADLYDLTLPLAPGAEESTARRVCEAARAEALKPSAASMAAVMDFELATRVNLALLAAGHRDCDVEARGGEVTVAVNRDVLRIEPLARELAGIARGVEGVTEVRTRVGAGYNRPDIVRDQRFDLPPPALLVDDEQEFVLTLSERLEMRDIRSEVVYDGAQALEYLEAQRPPVMVLDLRMPGMGGMEVLREVKERHPGVEVIILTGHGDGADEKAAMDLGAFAFLRKPVDIRELSEVMGAAARKAGAGGAQEATDRTAGEAGEQDDGP